MWPFSGDRSSSGKFFLSCSKTPRQSGDRPSGIVRITRVLIHVFDPRPRPSPSRTAHPIRRRISTRRAGRHRADFRAAQGAPAPSNGAGESHSSPSPANRKDRVPAGTAKGLIDRVLRERTSLGATPTEIQAAAETDVEKAISYSGLKFALTNGRDESRYENRGGRWFLKPQNGVPRSEAR